ncbi:MAG: 23S rRNA pseudouridine(2605) synthase RluB [Proteobacteria bacterium]|nr:23S rRNA pseudouridine(2605) synthase RluB [Pseudomonadota bacterium]
MKERLQKLLAQHGLGSRREIERWISDGRIKVNGKVAELGLQASSEDKIQIDGRLVKFHHKKSELPRVLIYHKPDGEICTAHDPENRPTVFENLPKISSGKWVMIGRLDVTTSGLLLFTDDGELANRLMHPKYELEREYAVRVFGEVTDDMLEKLKRGVKLEDGMASFDDVQFAGGTGANRWYNVTLHRGKNREVRRLWESQNVTVSRLMRIRYGSIFLPKGLRMGQYRELDEKEVKALLSQLSKS